jgi:hypothetical protein
MKENRFAASVSRYQNTNFYHFVAIPNKFSINFEAPLDIFIFIKFKIFDLQLFLIPLTTVHE